MNHENGQIEQINLDRIRPSKTNPRRHFEETALAELAASIKAHGVLQPILVRLAPGFELEPGRESAKQGFFWVHRKDQVLFGFVKNKKDAELTRPYELIAGERRYRAAKLAKLKVIPARVLDLNDREAAEIQMLENEAREDCTPLERARGYDNLIRTHKLTIDAVAQRIGKSPSTVRNLLRLLNLPTDAANALEAGTLPPSTAGLIARIPGEQARQEAAESILCNYGQGEEYEPMSFRRAKDLVERRYMVELKQACFDQKDKTLVPGVGSCKACPFRVGNLQKTDPDAYAGVRADVCTDPVCYRQKVEAWSKRQAAELEAQGVTFLRDRKHWELSGSHVQLDAPCWEEQDLVESEMGEPEKARTWQEVLDGRLDHKRVAVLDHAGRVLLFVPKKEAVALVLPEDAAERNGESPARSDDGHHWDREHRVQKRFHEAVREDLVRRCQGVKADASAPFLKLLLALELDDFLEFGDPEELQVILRRQGLPLLVEGDGLEGDGVRVLLDPWVRDKASAADVLALFVDLVLCRTQHQVWERRERPGLTVDLLTFVGLFLADLEQQARNELDPPAAKAGKGKRGKKEKEEPAHV